MTTKEAIFSKQTVQVIQGLLDVKPHPVAILDVQTNSTLFNDKWSDGLKNLQELVAQPSEKLITMSGKRFQVNKKELNHGTKCLMIELIPVDESISRLKAKTSKLDLMLKQLGG